MDIRAALKSQYHAALMTLRSAVVKCPKELWNGGEYPAKFWRVAYHTLFYTHFYLSTDEKAFRPWKKHQIGCQSDDIFEIHRVAPAGEPAEFREGGISPGQKGLRLHTRHPGPAQHLLRSHDEQGDRGRRPGGENPPNLVGNVNSSIGGIGEGLCFGE